MSAELADSSKQAPNTRVRDGEAPLVPASSIAGRTLIIVVAIMTFLASLAAGAWGSNSISESLGFATIGNVYDMSAQYAFGLTANDQASGTSVWVTQEIPAPGALALLGVAGLVARRRR